MSADQTLDPGARPASGRSRPDIGRGHANRSTSQEVRRADRLYCPDSVTGHDEGSRRDGRCTWCGFRFTGPAPRPRLGSGYRTELDQEYRRMYDPDYGADYWDT